ncbi:MAG: UDP-glucose 4-epimerase GalE [Gammaproteobacteria bacterium]|nr:UDP-glucose 4-epimerase GalE [Gammaproteobacteria bacterium]
MNKIKKVLVTGGAGYIGSHTCIELLNEGYEVVVFDNLCNSKKESLSRVEQLTGKSVEFIKADLRDLDQTIAILGEVKADAVIHFAGLKAVGESVSIPIEYYQNNITGTLNLCEAMKKHEYKNIVFSSSATVYGNPASLPIKEGFPTSATNPYGRSKLIVEDILQDVFKSDPSWNISLLRYFNPVGAHISGQIGEDPNDIPNNLMPYISQVAIGKLKELSVFGNDYDTPDGTGVRDYIHVVDLAKGHIAALKKLEQSPGVMIHNLGTGTGYSVLEMKDALAKSSNKEIAYKIVARREGDIASCYADPSLAKDELNWVAEKTLQEMCDDTWRWQSMNSNGFE